LIILIIHMTAPVCCSIKSLRPSLLEMRSMSTETGVMGMAQRPINTGFPGVPRRCKILQTPAALHGELCE
jgi:hypothetical protein